MIHKNA